MEGIAVNIFEGFQEIIVYQYNPYHGDIEDAILVQIKKEGARCWLIYREPRVTLTALEVKILKEILMCSFMTFSANSC